jgi:hypothetical protein
MQYHKNSKIVLYRNRFFKTLKFIWKQKKKTQISKKGQIKNSDAGSITKGENVIICRKTDESSC